ncbi:MAG: hypothetical protein RL266_1782 [Bacteroidota bacterium]|jgi:hypothetical protein
MKKLLLISAALLIGSAANAQTCNPDAQYAGSPPGLYPAGSLGPSCELTAAKTIISLTDTVVTVTNPFPITATLYITRLRINDIVGLPAGLLVSTDVIGSADQDAPWGYWENTGSTPNQTAALGCAYVYGSGGDWDAAIGGGLNNEGVYPLEFFVDAYVASANPNILGVLGGPQWVSTINPDFGGGEFVIYDTLVVASDYANISTSISGGSNVEPGTQYTYSVPQDPNVTYNWTATNGTIVSGQGTNSVDVTWNGSGNIEVELTDGGCQGVDDMDVTAIATGLDEVAGINASVYPNPSNGIFTLQLGSTDAINIRIMDVSGKVVRSEKLAGSTLYNIDMQNARIGVYVMEFETAEGRTFKKLIKN